MLLEDLGSGKELYMYEVVTRGVSGLTYEKELNQYVDANELLIELSAILFSCEVDIALDCYEFRHPWLTIEECVRENRTMLAKALWNARKLGWRYKKIKSPSVQGT